MFIILCLFLSSMVHVYYSILVSVYVPKARSAKFKAMLQYSTIKCIINSFSYFSDISQKIIIDMLE
jgi:phosphatidylglycerophosphate synthase